MQELLSQVNFHHLQVFRVVAKRLSYSRAAEELTISQPAVSRHVQALEKELGANLLGQTGNRVYLTDAGRVALAYAERVVELTAEATRALAELENVERGFLRLGASSAPWQHSLPEIVVAFGQRYPGVELTLHLANSHEIEDAVLRGHLDIGFVGARFLPELQVRPYRRDDLVLVMSPRHPFADRGSINASDLADVDLVMREQGSGTRRVLEEELARVGVRPRRLWEPKGCDSVKRAAVAGLGVAIVSGQSVVLELRCGELRNVEITDLRLTRDLQIVTRKDTRSSAVVLAFLAMARKMASA